MRRLTRALLALYPTRFRWEHGADALAVLRQDLNDARSRGPFLGRLRQVLLLAEFAGDGVRERVCHGFGAGFWSGWGQDIRHAFRSAGRRLGFTTVAVASLAVGVGANAVVFAVVDTFFLRDIPGVPEPERVVEMALVFRSGGTASWDYPDFLDVASQVEGLEHMALVDRGPVSLAADEGGERLLAQYVTSGYFPAMGVTLARGRSFGQETDRGPGEHPFVILSHRLWTERFGGDPGVVGRSLLLNREPHTVLGVAPPDFQGHEFGLQPEVWLPLTQHPLAMQNPELFFHSRGTLWASAVGRMRRGVELGELNASLQTVMRRLEDVYPGSNAERSARAYPAALMPAEARLGASVAFGLIGALMLLVLGATSANVGGMLLARAASRKREMAVRMALGSGRARVVRHLLTESLVIFGIGGGAGVYLATRGLRWLETSARLPTFIPMRPDFVLDARVLVFALALTGLVGLVFGLLPAVGTTREEITSGLRDGGAREGMRASRMRRMFVAGQVGVAVLLLAFSALFFQAVRAGGEIDSGFRPEGVYMTGFDLALEGYHEPAEAVVFLDRLLERVRALPGAGGATVASDFPLDGSSNRAPVVPDGDGGSDGGEIQSYYAHVSEGYFETLEIPLVAGRAFQAEDSRDSPRVAVVNRLLAETAWPGEGALGRTVRFGLEGHRYEVIGVVEGTQTNRITDQPAPQIFTLLDQDFATDLHIAVRRDVGDPDFVAQMRREMLAVDGALALSPTVPLEQLAALGTLPQRLMASVASILGLLALVLSSLGVYGVVAFMVTRRTREIGVRIALGSSRAQILRDVVADGLRLALPGFLVGLPLAVALSFAVRALLIGVSPLSPWAYLAVTSVFVAVVGGASLVPARRASGVQPVEALRAE